MGHITLNPKEEGKRGMGGAFAFLVGTVFELTLFPLGKGTKITEEGGCSGGMELKGLCNLPGKKRTPNSAVSPAAAAQLPVPKATRLQGTRLTPGDTAPGDTAPGDMAPGDMTDSWGHGSWGHSSWGHSSWGHGYWEKGSWGIVLIPSAFYYPQSCVGQERSCYGHSDCLSAE